MDSIKKTYKKLEKSLKVLNRNLNYVKSKSNELGFVLFLDILWCKIRYGITSNDYRIFEFYNIDSYKRNTYLSKRRYEFLNEKLVNKKITNIINNKEKFNSKFKDYLKRDICNINDMSFKQIEDFIIENKVLIARSNKASFISSYKEYNLKDYRSPAFMAKDMKDNKDYLVEKKFIQTKELNKISPLVFINVVSVYNKGTNIASSTLKFRNGNEVITGYIDINSKCIKGNFRNENGNIYKENYDGFLIPKFDSIINTVKKLCEELSELKQVEWSFIVGSKSIYLVDANIWDDYVFCQIPEYLDNKEGLMTYYRKY